MTRMKSFWRKHTKKALFSIENVGYSLPIVSLEKYRELPLNAVVNFVKLHGFAAHKCAGPALLHFVAFVGKISGIM